MEYLEMDIHKVNKFNFFNEEFEEFASRWVKSSLMQVNVKPKLLAAKALQI